MACLRKIFSAGHRAGVPGAFNCHSTGAAQSRTTSCLVVPQTPSLCNSPILLHSSHPTGCASAVLSAHASPCSQDIILAVDCHPEEGLVLSASKDQSVRVWAAASGSCLAWTEGHVDAVGAVACAPRSAGFCVSGSNDK